MRGAPFTSILLTTMLLLGLRVEAAAQTGSVSVGDTADGVGVDTDSEPPDDGPKGVKGGVTSPETNNVAGPSKSPVTTGTGTRASARRSDQDRALAAEKRGRVLPYSKIVSLVSQAVQGDIIRVRLVENVGSDFIYEVTVLDGGGRYTKVSLNARTGRLLSRKRR